MRKAGPKKLFESFFVRLKKNISPKTAKILVVSLALLSLFLVPAQIPPKLEEKKEIIDTPLFQEDVIDPLVEQNVLGTMVLPVGDVKAPILMYHYVEPKTKDRDRDKLLVTPDAFEKQLKFLKDNDWVAISLDELWEGLQGFRALPDKPVVLTFDDGYYGFYTVAWPILQKYGMKATVYVLSRGHLLSSDFYMTEAMLSAISADPNITIASHTQTHLYLKGRSEEIQRREIVESKKELEALTHKPVEHFAYPYGAYDEVSLKLVKEAGYKTATTTKIGTKNSTQDFWTLSRVRIGELSLGWFAAQLAR